MIIKATSPRQMVIRRPGVISLTACIIVLGIENRHFLALVVKSESYPSLKFKIISGISINHFTTRANYIAIIVAGMYPSQP